MSSKTGALLVLALLVLSLFASEALAGGSRRPTPRSSNRYGSGSVPQSQCGNQCNRRCSNTRYHKPCIFFCNKCCNKCLCVPPGTYGNKQVCPCYNNWKTQQGGPKCP